MTAASCASSERRIGASTSTKVSLLVLRNDNTTHKRQRNWRLPVRTVLPELWKTTPYSRSSEAPFPLECVVTALRISLVPWSALVLSNHTRTRHTDYCYQSKNVYRHQNILRDCYCTATINVRQDDKSKTWEQEHNRLPYHCTIGRAIDCDYRLEHRACQEDP